MSTMQPIVNINGTSREELVRMRVKASDALHQAMKAMQKLSPHMRDYLGNREAWMADRDVYIARFAALDRMANELMDEAYELSKNA
jgi:hypothetical protein